MNPLQRTLLEAVSITVLGLLAGLAVNHRLVLDAFSGQQAAPLPVASQRGAQLPQPVLLDEVRELVAAGALPVDARELSLYHQGHLPGALSLPLGDVDTQLAAFRLQVDPGRTLVVYCSGYGCADSFDLGQYLMAHGYQDVRVFEGGYPEWRDAGLAVVKEEN